MRISDWSSDVCSSDLGIKPRARIRAAAVIGSEPTIMLTGIAPASLKALKKAGMNASDIDLFEINEAFAAVVLRSEEHTSELQSLMRNSYAVFCLKKKKTPKIN